MTALLVLSLIIMGLFSLLVITAMLDSDNREGYVIGGTVLASLALVIVTLSLLLARLP